VPEGGWTSLLIISPGSKSSDLSWWRLIDAVPRPARILLSAMAFTAFFAPASTVVIAITACHMNGFSSGLTAGLAELET
jgi:hypothetical protein